MKCSDIPDEHVIALARAWHEDKNQPGVYDALVAEGVPPKVAWRKLEKLESRRLLDCGGSVRFAWPTDIYDA